MPPQNHSKIAQEFTSWTEGLEKMNQLVQQLGMSMSNLASSMTGLQGSASQMTGFTPTVPAPASNYTMSEKGVAINEADLNKAVAISEASSSDIERSGGMIRAFSYSPHGGRRVAASLPENVYNSIQSNNIFQQESMNTASLGAARPQATHGPQAAHGPQSPAEFFTSSPKYRMAGAGVDFADAGRMLAGRQDNIATGALQNLESAITKVTEESKRQSGKAAEDSRIAAAMMRDLANELKTTSSHYRDAAAAYERAQVSGSAKDKEIARQGVLNVLAQEDALASQAGSLSGRFGGGGDDGGASGGLRAGVGRMGRGLIGLGGAIGGAGLMANQYLGTEQAFAGAIYNKEIESMQQQSRGQQELFKQQMSLSIVDPRNAIMGGADVLMPYMDHQFIGRGGSSRAFDAAFRSEAMRMDMAQRERLMGLIGSGTQMLSGGLMMTGGPMAGGLSSMGTSAAGAGLLGTSGGISGMAKSYIGSDATAFEGGMNEGLSGIAGRFFFGKAFEEGAGFATEESRARFMANVMQKANSLRESESNKYQGLQMVLGQMIDIDEAAVQASGMTSTPFTSRDYEAYMDSHKITSNQHLDVVARNREIDYKKESQRTLENYQKALVKRRQQLKPEVLSGLSPDKIDAALGQISPEEAAARYTTVPLEDDEPDRPQALLRNRSMAAMRSNLAAQRRAQIDEQRATGRNLTAGQRDEARNSVTFAGLLSMMTSGNFGTMDARVRGALAEAGPSDPEFDKLRAEAENIQKQQQNSLVKRAYSPMEPAGMTRFRQFERGDPAAARRFVQEMGGSLTSAYMAFDSSEQSGNARLQDFLKKQRAGFVGPFTKEQQDAYDQAEATATITRPPTIFERYGITGAQYTMQKAMIESVSNTRRPGMGIDTGEAVSGAGDVSFSRMMNLSRNGVGSFSQLVGNLAQIGDVTGSRGEDSFKKLEDVMTKAVSAGFNGSHMAQKFVQSTLSLSQALDIRDIKGVSGNLAGLTGLLSATGDSSDPYAMRAAVQAIQGAEAYTAQTTGAIGGMRAAALTAAGMDSAKMGFFLDRGIEKTKATIGALQKAVAGDFSSIDTDTKFAIGDIASRKGLSRQAAAEELLKEARVAMDASNQASAFTIKFGLQGKGFNIGGQNFSGVWDAVKAAEKIGQSGDTAARDKFLQGMIDQSAMAGGNTAAGRKEAASMMSSILTQVFPDFMSASASQERAAQAKIRQEKAIKSYTTSSMQRFIDDQYSMMMSGEMTPEGFQAGMSTEEAKEAALTLYGSSSEANIKKVQGMSRAQLSAIAGRKEAEAAGYQKVFVTNFHEVHNSLFAFQSGRMKKTTPSAGSEQTASPEGGAVDEGGG